MGPFFAQQKRGGLGVTGKWRWDVLRLAGPGQPRMVDLRARRACNERSTGDSGESFDVKERRGTRSTRSGWRCFAVGRGWLLSCLV
jgi:hypothetical protein